MRLPRLPNSFIKSRAKTMQFLGITMSENHQEGEMSDCKNLSTLQYPTLSQRKGREVLSGGFENVTDMYEWDGHLILINNGQLLVDGEPIASVTDDRKQFAVINSRLVVFPDKISVDLRNNEFKALEATVTTTGESGTITFTSNSLTATLTKKVNSKSLQAHFIQNSGSSWSPFFYTYGTSVNAVQECWDEENATWDLEALEELKHSCGIGPYAQEAVNGNANIGQIFIPSIGGIYSYWPVYGNAKGRRITSSTEYPDTSEYNDIGHIAIITDFGDNWNGSNNTFDYQMYFDVYDLNIGQETFSRVFDVGDCVDITGTLHGLLDTTYEGDDNTTSSKIKIVSITEPSGTTGNTLTFANNTFNIPYAAAKLSSDLVAGSYYFRVKQTSTSSEYYYYSFTTINRIKKDQVIVIYGVGAPESIYVWDIEKHKVVDTYSGTRGSSAPSSGYTNLGIFALYNTSASVVEIKRSVPDLDFICERDNRLWGVSNSTKTIYCSALGLPWAFYDYSGLDTDSYAVAVGSAGDFTGIANYGGVICFKENKIHKMLGSFPSDFYMTTYEVPGVAKGAHNSIVVVSEILYYRAPLGVVAFTGYQPTNISPNLAMENTKGGVAGTNGREYYICVQAKDESHYTLFKYDLQYKIWIKEEDIDISSMAKVGNDLYMTVHTTGEVEVSGETITVDYYIPYKTGQENSEGMNLDWFAQFVPYIENAEGGFKKVGYSRLVLRFDMAPGSMFTIKVREDNGQWKQAWTQVATNKLSHTVPLRIGRCDKWELRLEGKGQTKIRAIQREFIQGGYWDAVDFHR